MIDKYQRSVSLLIKKIYRNTVKNVFIPQQAFCVLEIKRYKYDNKYRKIFISSLNITVSLAIE